MTDDIRHECTSWMLFPKLTGGKMLLHKNRDADPRGIRIYNSRSADTNAWVALGNSRRTNMVLNSHGLSIAMNSGELTDETEPPGDGRLTTPEIARELVENCTTAAQAVARYRRVLSERRYTHKDRGSIFFIMDTKTGYVVESTAHHALPAKVTGGMAIRANIWHNFGMSRYSKDDCGHTLDSASRELQVRLGLNAALNANGMITLKDIWRTSRLRGDEKAIGSTRGVCNKRTNSAATLSPDAEFTDVLSTIYVTIGPPAHTAFLPVPFCLDKVPQDIADGSWSDAAFARHDKFGLEFDDGVWLPLEDEMLAVFGDAQSSARELLRQNRRKEAIALMNKAFRECHEKAQSLVLKV